MHEFLKKNSTFVNVSIKNNKYGSDSIEEYTERRKKCIGKAAIRGTLWRLDEKTVPGRV